MKAGDGAGEGTVCRGGGDVRGGPAIAGDGAEDGAMKIGADCDTVIVQLETNTNAITKQNTLIE
ncbi:hypothetical protein Ddye_001489 [Dipteronia dyeriana]|uniref:Uncharacterized protein n=1 Tax=Dipteronia dyeriana TaxID=168575 RepID=A0AAD9XPC6_9ROSI|nr:hypothetical protein Ddye_001489 [Dipteronia dyeriana]